MTPLVPVGGPGSSGSGVGAAQAQYELLNLLNYTDFSSRRLWLFLLSGVFFFVVWLGRFLQVRPLVRRFSVAVAASALST